MKLNAYGGIICINEGQCSNFPGLWGRLMVVGEFVGKVIGIILINIKQMIVYTLYIRSLGCKLVGQHIRLISIHRNPRAILTKIDCDMQRYPFY